MLGLGGYTLNSEEPVCGYMENHLVVAAQDRHLATRAKAEAALLRLSVSGEQISFAAVAREGKVSTDFLYRQPDLRARISELRTAERTPRPSSDETVEVHPASTSSAVRALSALIKELKREHAKEVGDLRKALEVCHGETLALRRRIGRTN